MIIGLIVVGYLVKNVMNLIQIVSVKERIIMSDIFDSRDLLDELKTLDKEDDEERIEAIEELIEEVGEDNFEMGVAFIRENYWVEYCEDTAYDFGFLDRQNDSNPLHYHIDWQGWADAVAMDYNQTEFDGDNYYWRV